MLKLVGTNQPEPDTILLTAGALTAEFVAGNLRAIRYHGHEVLRGIVYLVRDKDWATYTPTISGLTIDRNPSAFTVRYQAICIDPATRQSLSYEARITASAAGHLSFSANATPYTPFLTARCGFAILHPLAGVTGHPARIEHVDGSVEDGIFPEHITPWQPFTEIRAITHTVAPNISATCRMEGDTFEMEDQRNWSDASYKTYVRPITLPWPYTLNPGVPNHQSIDLRIFDTSTARPTVSSVAASIKIEIGPEDGIFPAIGLSITPDQTAHILIHPGLLTQLQPQLLLFHFDPTAGHGLSELSAYARIAAYKNSELSLELVLPCQRDPRDELQEIAAQIAQCGLALSSLMLSPAVDRQSIPLGSAWPPCPPLPEIYAAAREAFPLLTLGGGSLSYFTEFNRKHPPVDALNFISHTTCPIVHAADDCSVMQTLETLPHIVRSTRALIGPNKPYRIGPSTIGMRHNPYGSSVRPNPNHQRIVMTDEDPRQSALFAAAWMIGYTAATAEGHLDALTVASLTGPLGLVSPTNAPYPVFHTAEGLIELGRRPRYRCTSSDPSAVLALAGLNRDHQLILWLANLTATIQTVALPPTASQEKVPIDLLPYATARIVLKQPAND